MWVRRAPLFLLSTSFFSSHCFLILWLSDDSSSLLLLLFYFLSLSSLPFLFSLNRSMISCGMSDVRMSGVAIGHPVTALRRTVHCNALSFPMSASYATVTENFSSSYLLFSFNLIRLFSLLSPSTFTSLCVLPPLT